MTVDSPEQAIAERALLSRVDQELVCLRYSYRQYYLPGEPEVELLALVVLVDSQITLVAMGECRQEALDQCQALARLDQLAGVAGALSWPLLDFREPLRLSPISIAKPWGKEVWYTGIESRGQSAVTDGLFDVPLPWLLSLAPDYLVAGRERSLNLLKILDPLPEPVFGDLYFELHQEKREVYVVTHVDEDAWPDAVGAIKIGFDPKVRSQFGCDQDFIDAFAVAVKSYESIRRQIDGVVDGFREAEGVGLNEPVGADQMKAWLTRVPPDLIAREKELRAKMDRFKGSLPLSIGDVLKVPCYTPHSLMHGVRTVEFQTPVYERQILSFAQKVLTQSQWDTQTAIGCMHLGQPEHEPLVPILTSSTVEVEEAVSFSDFDVWRITLKPGADYCLPMQGGYRLLIAVAGAVSVGTQAFLPEQAALLPSGDAGHKLVNAGATDAVVLVSIPK